MTEPESAPSEFEQSTFWSNNPLSSPRIKGEIYEIEKPWGDETLAIRITKNDEGLADFLQKISGIFLPKELSAIYHIETKSLEVIYTAAPIDEDIKLRRFAAKYCDKVYNCAFRQSSDVLLELASRSRPVQAEGATSYRNLPIYTQHLSERKRLGEGEESRYFPYSFWIDEIEMNMEELIKFLRHLNYQMSYFDQETPIVIIHQSLESISVNIERYSFENFPASLNVTPIDDTMLDLWEGTQVGDPFIKFIRAFQVIEYSAFYYMNSEVRESLNTLFSRPESFSNINSTVDKALDILSSQKMEDNDKIREMINKFCDPHMLWLFIEKNRDFFSREASFDGGFQIDPLIKSDWKLDDFRKAWHPKLIDQLIKIRNNLVHAREKRQSKSIFHSNRNRQMVRPWAVLISLIALQLTSTR